MPVPAATVDLAHHVEGPPEAPVVVLVSSLGTTWEMWDDLAAALRPSYRVVRFDTRGHGRSPVPEGPYTMDALAADVVALLDRLGVQRFAVVGLSLGGAIAQVLATSYAERVSALVLCCTLPRFGERSMWAQRASTVRAEGMAELAEATRARWFTEGFRADHPDRVEPLIAMLASTDPEGYAGCCEALGDFDGTDALSTVRVPTRVVAAAEDPVAPPDAGARMADAIPGADLVVVPSASHIAAIEQPAAFGAAVSEHLGRHA